MALSAVQEEFLDWLMDERPATGKEGGKGTQNQWARDHNLPVNTVAGWKKQDEFSLAWMAMANDAGLGPTHLQAMRDAMYEEGLKGNVRAAEIWIKLAEKLSPALFKPEDEDSSLPAHELSDEELVELLKAEVDKKR